MNKKLRKNIYFCDIDTVFFVTFDQFNVSLFLTE